MVHIDAFMLVTFRIVLGTNVENIKRGILLLDSSKGQIPERHYAIRLAGSVSEQGKK